MNRRRKNRDRPRPEPPLAAVSAPSDEPAVARASEPPRAATQPFKLTAKGGAPAPVVVKASDEPVEQSLGYLAGQVIGGKYQLLRLLAQGGMGAVWAAQNLVLDAQVALKLVHQDNTDPQASERMLREAQTVIRIEHA